LVNTAVAVSFVLTASVAASIVNVAEKGSAWVGPVDNKPKPRAATTASEIRLKIVFLFIDFLSLVIRKTFLRTASKE
jgi:hypothetical protein